MRDLGAVGAVADGDVRRKLSEDVRAAVLLGMYGKYDTNASMSSMQVKAMQVWQVWQVFSHSP